MFKSYCSTQKPTYVLLRLVKYRQNYSLIINLKGSWGSIKKIHCHSCSLSDTEYFVRRRSSITRQVHRNHLQRGVPRELKIIYFRSCLLNLTDLKFVTNGVLDVRIQGRLKNINFKGEWCEVKHNTLPFLYTCVEDVR